MSTTQTYYQIANEESTKAEKRILKSEPFTPFELAIKADVDAAVASILAARAQRRRVR